MSHWANQYIGIKWNIKGSEPEEGFNCWTFFQYIQRKYYNKLCTDIPMEKYDIHTIIKNFKSHKEAEKWREVDEPEDGCAVLMSTNTTAFHVGTWIQDDNTEGVLHCTQDNGVMFSSLTRLLKTFWKVTGFYVRK